MKLKKCVRAAQSLPYSFSHSSTTGADHQSFLSALHPAFGAAAAAGHSSHSIVPYYQELCFYCSLMKLLFPMTSSVVEY